MSKILDFFNIAMKEGVDVVHISHTDLDGYMCQAVIGKENAEKYSVVFENVNYGKGVEKIIDDLCHDMYDDYVLITDLGLTDEQCEAIEFCGANVLVMDHHPAEHADKYDWYHCDTSMSAGELVCLDIHGELPAMVKWAGAADIFRKEDINDFRRGRVMVDFFWNLWADLKPAGFDVFRTILFTTLSQLEFVDEGISPATLESLPPRMAVGAIMSEDKAENTTYREAINSLIADTIVSITYIDDGVLVTDIDGINISDIADLLLEFDDIDFIAQVKWDDRDKVYTVGCRTHNETARKVAVLNGGGGHPNAAGFAFDQDQLIGSGAVVDTAHRLIREGLDA